MKNSTQIRFVAAVVLTLASTLAWCDTSMLRPPKGSKVAIIVFEDLECPQCARAAPLLHEAAKKYDIPLIQHDFPLRQHPWSLEAAINARYFDTKSPKLGDEYRLFIFQNQNYVTKQNLRGMTEKWAEQHQMTLPFVVDPSGELANKVEADRQMGNRIPLDHTPTVYIVTDAAHVTPVTEVKDLNQLYQTLDELTKQAKESGTTTQAKKGSHSSATR
jgi:protein-disulfide isomerase